MKAKSRLSQAICKLRQSLNMNQTEFGARLGVSAMAVSRWEAGRIVPVDSIAKLAVMSGKPDSFWFFMGQIGLTKKNFKGRL